MSDGVEGAQHKEQTPKVKHEQANLCQMLV